MQKRDILVGGAGALTVGTVALNNPSAIGGFAAGTVGVVGAVGDAVTSVLNTVAPTAVAGFAAPFASAASSAYLADGAMNMIGVENKIARWLALGGSAFAGYGAGSVAQPFLVGAAAAKGLWDIGKIAWNSEALKKLSSPKAKKEA